MTRQCGHNPIVIKLRRHLILSVPRNETKLAYSGILNINKPAGMTSFDVVARVRDLTGERRVGHAGTLDPDATGVLPVAIGQATRLIEYLADSTKVYRAEIELGVTTDTYDASGNVISRCDPSGITEEAVRTALGAFLGAIQQVPPMFSAVRYQGRRLYKMAREGISVERPSREAHVSRIDLLGYRRPFLTLEIECGKGTYIRSIANDLGEKLGCGACMKTLVRLKVGPFDISGSITLDDLAEACRYGFEWRYFYAPDAVLLHIAAAVIDWDKEDAVKKGQKITFPTRISFSPGDFLRSYSHDGRFIGVLRFDGDPDRWQPDKIFN